MSLYKEHMNIEVLRKNLKTHYKSTSCNEPYDVDKLTNDEILQFTKTLDLVKNTDDDTIEEIPAPIFFDLFN